MTSDVSPFHKGELAVQKRMGVRDQVAPFAARVIRDHMPDQHRIFYNSLPLIFVGAVDKSGWPWATVMVGEAGFMTSPDPQRLNVQASLSPDDPLRKAIVPGSDVGLLGLQLETRRRNRMNGHIERIDTDGMSILVHQAFGNCPQYIHRRSVASKPMSDPSDVKPIESDTLQGRAAQLVARADTMFVATSYEVSGGSVSSGADVSHRGGRPGFVEMLDERTIIFPDYSGNNHFNTVGNLVMNPKVGFLFIDFDTGDLVYVSGEAEIIWDGNEVSARPGAQRVVKCNVRSVRHLPHAVDLAFDFVDYSPSFSPVE